MFYCIAWSSLSCGLCVQQFDCIWFIGTVMITEVICSDVQQVQALQENTNIKPNTCTNANTNSNTNTQDMCRVRFGQCMEKVEGSVGGCHGWNTALHPEPMHHILKHWKLYTLPCIQTQCITLHHTLKHWKLYILTCIQTQFASYCIIF